MEKWNAQNLSDLCLTTLGMVEYKRRQIGELKAKGSGQMVIATTWFDAKKPRVAILSVRIKKVMQFRRLNFEIPYPIWVVYSVLKSGTELLCKSMNSQYCKLCMNVSK